MPVDTLNEKLANQLINGEVSLIDIEAPLAPISNWGQWIDWALWILLAIFIIGLLAKLSFRLYRPAYLRWKLSQLSPTSESEAEIPSAQAWQLYGWCIQLKNSISQYQSPSELMQNPAFMELENLIQQVEQLSFSKQSVSRETYLSLLAEANQVLQLNCGFSPLVVRFKKTVQAKLGGHD